MVVPDYNALKPIHPPLLNREKTMSQSISYPIIACLTALLSLSPLSVLAAEAKAPQSLEMYLERAGVSGLGNQLRLYRVPVINSAGKTDYVDMDLVFNLDEGGKGESKLSMRASPAAATMAFIPGNYLYTIGLTKKLCDVGVGTGLGGRTVGSIRCDHFSANWMTGPIDGHPFQPKFISSNPGAVAGADLLAWGTGTATTGYSDIVPQPFIGTNIIISAQQTGNTLTLTAYDEAGKAKGAWTFSRSEK